MTPAGLEIRFLGEMTVVRQGERVELPPSKKTRALLAYLVLTARPHRRERLCTLLWDAADDPRGALRWSLSRLRAVTDEPDRARIVAERERISFEPHGAWVDLLALKRRVAAGLDGVSLEELTALVNDVRGELLEGLGLDDFLDFQAWCVAEREGARKLHAALLRALVARLEGDAERALPHARALAAVEPLDSAACASLIRLLGVSGRLQEAETHYEASRRLMEELGRSAAPDVESAWRTAREFVAPPGRRAGPPPAAPTAPTVRPAETARAAPPPAEPEIVGRSAERTRLREMLAAVRRERRAHGVLVTGEPGMGKTRLLEELCDAARADGAEVLVARAFEAEATRPFGPWVDLLRQLPPAALGASPDLCALLPERSGPDAVAPARERIAAALVEQLAALAADAPAVVLFLDDAQWLDAASAELLHVVARNGRALPLLLALAARAGELFDNEVARRTLRGLRELKLVEEIRLGALEADDTRRLVEAVAPGADASALHAESGGNPMLALELARSLADDRPMGRGGLPATLAELIRSRMERLPPEALDVLRWGSALDSGFQVGRLGKLMALPVDKLLDALSVLERHGLLRARAGSGRGTYEFAHELVRKAIYSDLSLPRRKLMHHRIAKILGVGDAGDVYAAELVHHASLAGDAALAAEACVTAGRVFLRQRSIAEALAAANRGRRHAAALGEPRRSELLRDLDDIEQRASGSKV